MKDLYLIAGISRQAVYKAEKKQVKRNQQQNKFFEQADQIRKGHPRVGCRKMAWQLRCPGWGRDKLEDFLLSKGYRVRYKRRFIKTTQRQCIYDYPNLIQGLKINNINKIVQTDITYYRVKDRFYYLTFIQDVYSRKIVGYAVSDTLQATANMRALRMMLRSRKNQVMRNLIHHSDKGSQFIYGAYLEILNKQEMKISMCDQAWENPYAERINRTIKEEYLDGWRINSYQGLKQSVRKAVIHYNVKRQHNSLTRLSPEQFEQQLSDGSKKGRKQMIL